MGLTAEAMGGAPMLQAALRFSAYQSGVACVIIGSSSADHMRDNARALEDGPLPAAAIRRIRESFARAGAEWPALG
jgi:aryl-alcohol dehydrogenase-like predicted oxidoreductase